MGKNGKGRLGKDRFIKAKPIFRKGYDGKGNYQAGFICRSEKLRSGEKVFARVCAGTFYRLYVNGVFVAHGPARAGEGFLRADDIDVSGYIRDGVNYFAFEVVHYGEPFGQYSNDVSRVKPLLLAEISLGNGDVIASTSPDWKAIELKQRVRHAERISHCRESAENYYIDDVYTRWRTEPELCDARTEEVDCPYTILERGMALPTLEKSGGGTLVDFGRAELEREKQVKEDWFCAHVPGYFTQKMERPVLDYRKTVEKAAWRDTQFALAPAPDGRLTINGIQKEDTVYVHYDLGALHVGFISVKIEVERPCVLDIVHLESYRYFGRKDEVQGGANPVTRLHIPAGKTEFITFEPACVRYIKMYIRPAGDYSIEGGQYCRETELAPICAVVYPPEIIEYTTPDTKIGSFQCSDDDINRLYDAARRTLRLNTLDIFMDCPERERGGWLCDSLWTARAFNMMMGNSSVEREFIRNFLLTDPESMWHAFFPECYPGIKPDFKACSGLLTWPFWLMIELCEYVRRSNDIDFKNEFEARVEAFVNGSLELRGESGLLENMPWIFIDWSLANDFCRPISTAANALYARMMIELGTLYGREDWTREGNNIRRILREVLAGSDEKPRDIEGFLPDALEYKDGKLRKCGNYSESAQYTMIWAGLFTKEEMPCYIWRLVHTTGADREFECDTRLGKAGLFIGLCIRLDMLSRLGEYDVMYRELQAIYMPQLREGPGTLWETQDVVNTSRCHGFSAHAGVLLTRDILGLGEPDEVNKTVRIDPHPMDLRWARGTVNTSDGLISFFWTKDYLGKIEYRLTLPDGWKAITEEGCL